MKKTLLVIISMAILSVSFTTLLAQKSKRQNRENGIKEKLNLTETQLQKFDDFRFAFQENKIEIEADLKKNKLKLRKLMTTKNINESGLLSIINTGSGLKAELAKKKVKMWLRVLNILDEDQKNIWIENFQMMEKKGRRFFNKCGTKKFRSKRDHRFGNQREFRN